MNAPYSSSTVLVSVVAAALVLSCDDFTCADYATCEPPDIAVDGSTAPRQDAGGETLTASGIGTPSSASDADVSVASSSMGSELRDASVTTTSDLTTETDSGHSPTLGADPGAGLRDGGQATLDASELDLPSDVTAVEPTSKPQQAESIDAGVSSTNASVTTGDPNSEEQSATGTGVDAAVPRCDPAAPFGRPFPLAVVNLSNVEENVALSQDGLDLYVRYGSDLTMYVATRADVMGDFETPRSFTALDNVLEMNPELNLKAVSADGLTVYLSDDSTPLVSARRQRTADAFGDLIIHEELGINGLPLVDPWFSVDEQRVYGFVLAYYPLVVAERGDLGFGEIVRVDEVGSIPSSIYRSVLLPDETVVYSTVNDVSDAQDTQGLSAIARGTRPSTSDTFAEWEYVEVLDGPGGDWPVWVAADDCEIILGRNVEGLGEEGPDWSSDIYVARRAN